MKRMVRPSALVCLMLAITFFQAFCSIQFATRGSSMVVYPGGMLYLGDTDSIFGWSRESIVQAIGNNQPSYWDPIWTGTQRLTYATTPMPDLPRNLQDQLVETYYYELTEDLFLGPNKHLIVEGPLTQSNYTFINGNGYSIFLAEGFQDLIQIAPDQTVVIANAVIHNYDEFALSIGTNANLSFLNLAIEITNNRTFSIPLDFSGSVLINGYGYTVTLNPTASINVSSGQLAINNLALYGVQDQNLRNLTDNGSLVLQNCDLFLTGDYRFKTGGLQMINSTISGFHGFNFESSYTFSISRTLLLDTGVTFSYSPSVNNRNLVYMDPSAILYLNGCTLQSTTTGMILTNGTLVVDSQNSLYNTGATSVSQGVQFGNGNASNDLSIEILPGASLSLESGKLIYANVN